MNLAYPWALLLSAAVALAAQPTSPETAAPSLLADAALPGGLCVHLGCGDGAMTDALRGGGRFLVHGLDADPARVDQARRFLQARGVYGQAWVEVFAGSRLPYAENLVNLLVVDAAAWEVDAFGGKGGGVAALVLAGRSLTSARAGVR